MRQEMQESLSDRRCRILSTKQRMQESLYQTADAGKHFIRQEKQESLYQTADAGDTLRQQMQECLYQTADAGDTLSDSKCKIISIRQW